MTFIKREEGQGLVEYALLLVLIAVVVIGALFLLGDQLRSVYGRIIGALGGGGLYTYQIQGQSHIKKANSGSGCTLTAQNMSVKVEDAGVPVDGLPVTVEVTVSPFGSHPFTASTNPGGIASWNTQSYFIGVACTSIPPSAQLSIAGGAATGTASISY
jgi:pilus assembly protein Flp/PilA